MSRGKSWLLLCAVMALAVTPLPTAIAHPADDATSEPSHVARSSAAARLAADPMLERPTGGRAFQGPNMRWQTAEASNSPECLSVHPICIHWTKTGENAPPAADADSNNIPDQVEQTLAAASRSWNVIVNHLGFRAPLPDSRSRSDGGNNKFDIYLADTGSRGLGGYVSSDDRRLRDSSTYAYNDVSAFMVVDNDFRAGQFPYGTSDGNLKVTVAHELFHASQFAYDHAEDRWFTEGTATWIEDQVYDNVDLNRGALSNSPLGASTTSLDYGRSDHAYGTWIFFRYLSEKYGPQVIRRAWHFADDSPAQLSPLPSRTYSLKAIAHALKREHVSLHNAFANFARDNLYPAKTYDEGAAYPKPISPTFTLTKRRSDTNWLGLTLDHLSAAYATFAPGDDVPRKGRVKLLFNGPSRKIHPAFRVTVRFRSGAVRHLTPRLDRDGNGVLRAPFGRHKILGIDVTLINASTRMHHCYANATPFACSGKPAGQERTFLVRARLP